jgi:TonB family protein
VDFRFKLACALVLGVLFASAPEYSLAKSADNASDPGDRVVLTTVSPPVYPPLARQARINGEVDLALGIRPDGTVGSVSVISGHPMLRSVALESAQRSQFECSACTADLTPYTVRYKFELLPLDHTKDCATLTDEERNVSPPPSVDLSHHEVTVFGKVMETCDPAVTLREVRSAKCLYLWRCGRREVTQIQ